MQTKVWFIYQGLTCVFHCFSHNDTTSQQAPQYQGPLTVLIILPVKAATNLLFTQLRMLGNGWGEGGVHREDGILMSGTVRSTTVTDEEKSCKVFRMRTYIAARRPFHKIVAAVHYIATHKPSSGQSAAGSSDGNFVKHCLQAGADPSRPQGSHGLRPLQHLCQLSMDGCFGSNRIWEWPVSAICTSNQTKRVEGSSYGRSVHSIRSSKDTEVKEGHFDVREACDPQSFQDFKFGPGTGHKKILSWLSRWSFLTWYIVLYSGL